MVASFIGFLRLNSGRLRAIGGITLFTCPLVRDLNKFVRQFRVKFKRINDFVRFLNRFGRVFILSSSLVGHVGGLAGLTALTSGQDHIILSADGQDENHLRVIKRFLMLGDR